MPAARNSSPAAGTNPRESSLFSPSRGGFTLVELLVSTALLILMLGLVVGLMSNTSNLWIRHRNQSSAFAAASAGFDLLTRNLAQAILNTSWQVSGNGYSRASEMHFIMGPASQVLGAGADDGSWPTDAVFFQAPLGRAANRSLRRLPALLNGLGYFVHFSDTPDVPGFLQNLSLVKSRYRFRLYEWIQPTETLSVFAAAGAPDAISQRSWFSGDVKAHRNTAVVAENVIGLVLLAEYPKTDGSAGLEYSYDSRDGAVRPEHLHQMPPRVRVVLGVIDEASGNRLAERYGESVPPLSPPGTAFQDPANYQRDLAAWEEALRAVSPTINFRLFTATVYIQNAAWSL